MYIFVYIYIYDMDRALKALEDALRLCALFRFERTKAAQ